MIIIITIIITASGPMMITMRKRRLKLFPGAEGNVALSNYSKINT